MWVNGLSWMAIIFFLPATCQFSAVTHSNAELKPLEQTFYWKGDAGTGQVTFRALIKQGEQNHGNFYKPANLVLTEAPTPVAAQTVWKSAPGASCDETCGVQNMACDQTATLNLNSATALQSSVQNYYACREPYLKACAPPATGANSFCYYYGCTSPQTYSVASTCSRRSSDPIMNQQFCACKAGTVKRDPHPAASSADYALGYRLAAPLQLDPELTINSIEIFDDMVTIDLSGPQERWFAIGWNASYMDETYATVVWLNDPTIRPPQNYASIGDLGYQDGAQGWYDARCQQVLNDYCRNVGSSTNKTFSCALANTTNQYTAYYSASNPNTFSPNLTSHVPCKGGKVAPYLPMTVAEYRLHGNRSATLVPSSITPIRSLVDGGQFRISFTRNVSGAIPFPAQKSIPIIWSLGVQQFFGLTVGNTFIKHYKKSETQVTIQLAPIYPVCHALSDSSTSLPSMLVLGSLMALVSKNWVLGALLAVFVRPAAAHNWVNTPSRAQIAAVTVPCVTRINPAPHLQVTPGQEFQMEWSTGHGDTPTIWTYWVFIKEESYMMLADIQDSDLEDYLDKAPDTSKYVGNKWIRRHLAPYSYYNPGCVNCNNGSMYPTTFAKQLLPGDPDFIVRDPIAMAKSLKGPGGNVSQWWYPAAQTAGDERAEYTSIKYPGIISVHKFRIAAHWPDEYDIATFTFPKTATTGNYIAHFKWGGYRDCTDVHIVNMATPTALPWGQVTNANVSATFARLDHCEFTFVLNPSTRCKKMTNANASQCLADCLKLDGTFGCTGVQAVLRANPSGTLPYTPNYPYKQYTRNDTAFLVFPPLEYGPCDSRTINKRNSCPDISTMCNNNDLANISNTDYLCYGLTPYRDQDFQTTDDYVISTDPTDPGFYSTCWVRLAPGGFQYPFPDPLKPPPVWRVGKQCLSCDWLQNKLPTYPPNWAAPPWGDAFATECMDCDVALATGCNPDVSFIEGGDRGNCSTPVPNGQTCAAKCNPGFSTFGDSRVCENGILTGTETMCIFKGC